MMTEDRRLIEDYLPLDVLNAIASMEKKHPRRYVELVHYWPARRPITACRAAIYAALAPAPRTDSERDKASDFVAKLAAYKPAPKTISEARQRIKGLHDGQAPKVLDMFAGGGAIPLEAARLGCESHAVDYNPVAYLIELCTLVYPQTFGASLADDFQRWSALILDRMLDEIGDLYPAAQGPADRGGHLSGSALRQRRTSIHRLRRPCRLHLGAHRPVPAPRLSGARPAGATVVAAQEGRRHRRSTKD